MTSTSRPEIPLIAALSDVAPRYDALLCDVWGVLHNGRKAFDGAVSALLAFKQKGGAVLLLSNAPRPSHNIHDYLQGLGVPRECYHDMLTSGDAVQARLKSGVDGAACYHLGPARDRPLFDGTGMRIVEEPQADFVLCSGLFDDEVEGPDDYVSQLERFRARSLRMICANPDIVVHRGEKLIYCAGAIAERYAQMGGEVLYFGKPHAPVYELALDRLAGIAGSAVARERVLAIGDGIHTDIEGANAQNIDSLFVSGGIAAEEYGDDPERPDPEHLHRFFVREKQFPKMAIARLR